MSMLYFCARFSRRYELQGYRADVQRIGHVCTSRWIDLVSENEVDAAACAKDDLADLRLADVVVAFGEKPRETLSRGGRHVEFGYGLALNKKMILVGHRENIFAHLKQVEFFDNWPMALSALTRPMRLAA